MSTKAPTPPTAEKPANPVKIELKNIKHVFTPDEIAQLNVDFRQAFENLKSVEAEFDNVKALWKAKTTEAEARMETLNVTLNAGFKMRDERCRVIFDAKARKKFYHLELDGGLADPVLVEEMTQGDFQADLILAESKFNCREEIELFPRAVTDKGVDFGTMVVGRFNTFWFAGLRANIGNTSIEERLDSEQPSSKKRADAIKRTANRFSKWVTDSLGKEVAKGFEKQLDAVIEVHKEREE